MSKKVPPLSVEHILERLRAEGMRITDSRRHILDALFGAKKPLSLQEIQELANEKGGGPDYATVFRMMALLERLGLVQKVNLQRSCSYYELRDPSRHYDHIVCTLCGKVVIIDLPCPLGEAEKFIASRYGFSNLTHSLEFFGQCPDCLESQKVA
jgi:Fur family transcriptional regulator, ferric uptake regulator